MPALPLLAPDIAQSLKRAVRHAASEALKHPSASSKFHDALTQRRLNAELTACVAEAVSDMSSAFNAEATVLARFSNELWCIVFSYLPPVPLITATHVCRNWRNIALCCSTLWCSIDFWSDWHDDDSECPEGRVQFGRGSNNLELVQAFLSRSGNILPIFLDVDIMVPHYRTSCPSLKHLADVLQPFAHRLAALHFVSATRDAHMLFLTNFDCLSALHTLSMRCSQISRPSFRGALFLSRPLSLPALRKLHIVVSGNTGLFSPDNLSSLASLDIGFIGVGDILAYLNVSPNLRQLRLHAPSFLEREPAETYRRVREQTTAGDIEIMQIHATVEAAILAMFDSDSHTSLLLDYRCREDLYPRVLGMRILRHLECVEELSVIPRPVDAGDPDGQQQVVVSAHDFTSKFRTLSFVWEPHMVRLSDIWGHLNMPPLSLVVDARLWSMLHTRKSMSIGIKSLTLILSPPFTLAALMQTSLTVFGPFTALEELTISSKSLVVRISTATVRSFLRLLRMSGLVHVLQFRRVEIDGDVTPLRAMARTVLFQ